MKSLLFATLFLCLGINLSAQKTKAKEPNFQEGKITYALEVDGEGAEEAKRMLNTTVIALYVKGESSRFDVSVMGGFAKFQFIRNGADKTNTMIFDVPMIGEKSAVSFGDDDEIMQKLNQNRAPEQENPLKFKGKKRIAKYKCKRGSMDVPDAGGTFAFYLTEQIRPFFGVEALQKLGGFPLGFEMEVQGITVKMFAQSVEKKTVETTMFSIPEGYEKKSMEEFRQQMQDKMGGGMNGIGL